MLCAAGVGEGEGGEVCGCDESMGVGPADEAEAAAWGPITSAASSTMAGAGSRSSRPRVPGTPAAGERGWGLGWCHCCAVLHTQEGRALGSQGAGVLTQPCHRTCVSHGACCSHASSASELRCSWVSTRSKLGLRLGSRCQQAASSVLMPGGCASAAWGGAPPLLPQPPAAPCSTGRREGGNHREMQSAGAAFAPARG